MSVGNTIRAAFIAVALFLVVFFVAGRLLGPGVGDFSESIINGYEYHYLGGDEKMIVRKGYGIVVDSKIEGYRVDGDKLFVVRRPREVYKDGALTKGRLANNCEYLVVNTINHQIDKVDPNSKFHDLKCHGT